MSFSYERAKREEILLNCLRKQPVLQPEPDQKDGHSYYRPPRRAPADATSIQNDRNHQDRESLSQSIREWLRFGVEIVALIYLVRYVDATQHQVAESRHANQIARDALESGERPWIGLSHFGEMQDYRIGGKPHLEIEIKNFGKTPAVDVKVTSGMVIATKGMFSFAKTLVIPPITPASLGPIFPEGRAKNSVGIWVPFPAWEMTNDSSVPGTPELIMFGLITYRDRLGQIHHTPICEKYHPEVKGFTGDGSCATDKTIPKID